MKPKLERCRTKCSTRAYVQALLCIIEKKKNSKKETKKWTVMLLILGTVLLFVPGERGCIPVKMRKSPFVRL